jgi:hypothetical protein
MERVSTTRIRMECDEQLNGPHRQESPWFAELGWESL